VILRFSTSTITAAKMISVMRKTRPCPCSAQQAHEDGQRHFQHIKDRLHGANAGLAGNALGHLHRHFQQPQPGAVYLHQCLHLGEVFRISVGEQADGTPAQDTEPGGRVGNPGAANGGKNQREKADSQASGGGGLKAAGAAEARAQHQVAA
jgi:hypothetical protein